MADRFGADPAAARSLSEALTEIRSQLATQGRLFHDAGAATGSQRVAQALTDFSEQSGDARQTLDHLLERASGLLGSLADGVTVIDHGLAAGLDAARDGVRPSGPS